MSWIEFITIGNYQAYNVPKSLVKVEPDNIIKFSLHCWQNKATRAKTNESVNVYVLVGSLSNVKYPAIVVLLDGTIEAWAYLHKDYKS